MCVYIHINISWNQTENKKGMKEKCYRNRIMDRVFQYEWEMLLAIGSFIEKID